MTVRPVVGRKIRPRRFCIPQSRLFAPFRKNGSLRAGTSRWKFLDSFPSSAFGTRRALRLERSVKRRRDTLPRSLSVRGRGWPSRASRPADCGTSSAQKKPGHLPRLRGSVGGTAVLGRLYGFPLPSGDLDRNLATDAFSRQGDLEDAVAEGGLHTVSVDSLGQRASRLELSVVDL